MDLGIQDVQGVQLGGAFHRLWASVTSQPRAGTGEEWEKSSLKRLGAFNKWWEVAEPREQGVGGCRRGFPKSELHNETTYQKDGEGTWPDSLLMKKANKHRGAVYSNKSPGLQLIGAPTIHHMRPQMLLALNHQAFLAQASDISDQKQTVPTLPVAMMPESEMPFSQAVVPAWRLEVYWRGVACSLKGECCT